MLYDLCCVVRYRGLKRNVAVFFGVATQTDEERRQDINQWNQRSQRAFGANPLFGGFKQAPPRSNTVDSVFDPPTVQPSPAIGRMPQLRDPLARGHRWVVSQLCVFKESMVRYGFNEAFLSSQSYLRRILLLFVTCMYIQ